jgi:hypothetical protein
MELIKSQVKGRFMLGSDVDLQSIVGGVSNIFV